MTATLASRVILPFVCLLALCEPAAAQGFRYQRRGKLLSLPFKQPSAFRQPQQDPGARSDRPSFPRLTLRGLTLRGLTRPGLQRPGRSPLTKGLKGFTTLGRALSSETGQWALATGTLGAAEATYIASSTTPLLTGIQRLGFVGGAGLTWSAVRDMRAARTVNEKLDAAGDLSWGVEGMLEFSPIFSNATGKLAPLVGTLGGLCQTGVGIRRIWQGVRQRDWCKVKLGALDVASGGLWLAWDLFGIENPLVIGGFVGLMVGREVYANRKEICAWGKRVGCSVAEKFKAGTRRLRDGTRLFKRNDGESSLRRLGHGLDPVERPLHGPGFGQQLSRPPSRAIGPLSRLRSGASSSTLRW